MISEQEFTTEFSTLSAFFERRRRKYLWVFAIAVAAAISLLLSAALVPEQVMRFISLLFFIHRPVTSADIIAYRIFAACLSILLVVRPVHYYRNMRFTPLMHAGQSTHFSLKDAAYTRMFALFGDYEFTPQGSIPHDSIRKSLLCGSYPQYRACDVVSGKSHTVGVKCCDVAISHPKDNALPPFEGVLIVCDITQLQVKLRLPFRGKMVLAPVRMSDRLTGKPGKNIPLPEAYDGYSACGSDAEEARRVVGGQLANLLEEFRAVASLSPAPSVRVDDWIANTCARLVDAAKETFIGWLGKAELPAEKTYDAAQRPQALPSPYASDEAVWQRHFAVEYYDDKCLFFIPSARRLIESKSLFEPVMTSGSAHYIYALMRCVDGLCKHLNAVMP